MLSIKLLTNYRTFSNLKEKNQSNKYRKHNSSPKLSNYIPYLLKTIYLTHRFPFSTHGKPDDKSAEVDTLMEEKNMDT